MNKTLLGMGGLKKKWQQGVLNDIKRLKLPAPDHEYGFSSTLLKAHLSEQEWAKFCQWMFGQTCAMDDKLGLINYTSDVIRGLDFIRHKVPTYFD